MIETPYLLFLGDAPDPLAAAGRPKGFATGGPRDGGTVPDGGLPR